MEILRKTFHKPDGADTTHPVAVAWDALTVKSPDKIAVKTKNTIGMSIARSVFGYCEHRVVSMKGNTLLCDWEQTTSVDLEETGLDIDEASLYRLGGYALYSTIMQYEKR